VERLQNRRLEPWSDAASQLAEKSPEIGVWSLERARLQAAPHNVSKGLRHGWEAVPVQNFRARRVFPQPLPSRAQPL